MRSIAGLLITSLVLASAAGCVDDSETSLDESGLIGGALVPSGEFPSTVFLASKCSAVVIGRRQILTAAHCVYSARENAIRSSYKAGRRVSFAHDPMGGFTEREIRATYVTPSWQAACEAGYCAVASAKLLDAADAALIVVTEDIVDVPPAVVDEEPVGEGELVAVEGYGCEQGYYVAPDPTVPAHLRSSWARVLSPESALHPGSFVKPSEVATLKASYLLTPGPGNASPGAGLCPGDSGGPLYRKRGEANLVAGINANYTFAESGVDRVGLPVTNWHTRLDKSSRFHVGAWLRELNLPDAPATAVH